MKKAFTLAEVLITLGIIGVVSALTLSSVITNYQKHVTVIQLKKAYNTVSTILYKSQMDYGQISTWSNLDFYKIPTIIKANISDPYTIKYTIYNTGGVSVASGANFSSGATCSKDGMCFHTYSVLGENYFAYYYIIVDLNGPKKPNRVGRDIFYFAVSKKAPHVNQYVYSVSESSTRNSLKSGCNKTNTSWNNGASCFALIVKDGWKIADDYPW